MVPQTSTDGYGHSSVRMTFDLYGHLFDGIETAPTWRRSAAIRAA